MSKLTESDKSRQVEVAFALTDKQHIAIKELVMGKTDEEAAKAAGVTRQTVNEWRRNNPAFRTEWINLRAELWQNCLKPLREAILSSLETVNKSIKSGDLKAAQWILDKVGIDAIAKNIFNSLNVESTDIETQAKAVERMKEALLRMEASEKAKRRIQAVKDKDVDFIPDAFKYDQLEKELFNEELERLEAENKHKQH